jgi:zinc/manganese transport system substrate-binding protein
LIVGVVKNMYHRRRRLVTMVQRRRVPVFVGVMCSILLICLGLAGCSNGIASSSSANTVLNVVAGQNFWGSIASQLGGIHASVTSIVSDPNADPHQYTASANDARIFATAQYVILNGAGYDDWGQQLLSANQVSGRKVLTVATLLGKKDGDNPHMWYDPNYVETVANQISKDYQSLDPKDSAYFTERRQAFETALGPYHQRLNEIKSKFSGRKVGSTESIIVYMANYLGLDLISPPDFMQAVAESNDPPADSVVTFEQQIQQKQISVLVFNVQTVTPITDHLKALAAAQGIPLVSVSETIQPPDVSFQDWQIGQLDQLQNALNAQALGQ